MAIPLLVFANLVECPELLAINTYIGKSMKMNIKTRKLLIRYKKSIQDYQKKDIRKTEMT